MYFGEGENVKLATLLEKFYAKFNYNVGWTFMNEKKNAKTAKVWVFLNYLIEEVVVKDFKQYLNRI